ncbi:hypothetical protein EJB05_54699, partial [Eragrostis curvula]
MASSDNDDYYCCSDDDDVNEYDDCAEEEDDRADDGVKKKEYDLETEDDVRKKQDEAVAKIAESLAFPPGFAAVALRHFQWDTEQLGNEWFDEQGRIREKLGLPANDGGVDVPTALNDGDLTCAICFDGFGPGEMRSAGCRSHFYCHECWRGYIRAAVGDGARCLTLRCPDPRCRAAVARELVDAVAGDDDRARYATFFLRSFVEEGKSKLVRWCPGPGCTRAVRSRVGASLREVSCDECGHVFCFGCGGDQEPHRPASCDTARAWVAKHSSDGETANWVLANTKHCPKCRRAIEKNQGCMHMTCSAPCRHEFCWLCLGPWEPHGSSFFSCNRYNQDKAEGKLTEADNRQRQAQASLERYLHYYERWTAFGASRKKAREDLDGLQDGGLDAVAAEMGRQPTEMDFLMHAYAQIVESRRVLRWTYAYVYYMDPERDGAKRELCEHLQGEAEGSLERLHDCAEKERQDLVAEVKADPSAACVDDNKFAAYREKLSNLTSVTKNHFNNLVKGFEDGIAEVVV